MIKWVKFFSSGDGLVKTLFTENGLYQDDGMTHQFATAQEAMEKSTKEVVVFWNGLYQGVGHVEA